MRALAVSIVVLGVLALATVGESQGSRCKTGEAWGFASIRPDPAFLVGTIPSRFTREAGFFDRRYNCRGQSAEVRRIDLGTYDVRFPGLQGRSALVSAYSQEGVSASVFPFDGVYRVTLRGPLIENNVTTRRDVPFTIVVY